MRRLIFVVCLLLLSVYLIAPASVRAATSQVCTGSAADARQLVINCSPGYATDHDQIIMYSPRDLDPTQDWAEQLNYTDAIWAFDRDADQTTNLLIVFSAQGQTTTAEVYDSQNGVGTVAWSFNADGSLSIGENGGHPTFRVRVQNGWWLPNGAANSNYDIEVDGPVDGMIDASSLYLNQVVTDGRIDLTAHVRDTDRDGRPDYEWRQAYPPLADEDGYYHSSVMVNTADDEPSIGNSLFWPLLGSGATGFIKEGYRDTSPAPLNIDWTKSRFTYLVESVASRNRPHNYFVYSIERIKEGQVNDVNFESPFAFYQFSPVQSNFPDVALRVAYYPYDTVAKRLPVEQVDFSWRQTPTNSSRIAPDWDYRLGLLGHNAHAGVVSLPDFGLRITPYDQLPQWAATNTWDYASFVAREDGDYLSSEGIYEWAALEGAVNDVRDNTAYKHFADASGKAAETYVRGTSDDVPDQYYQHIRAGLRGEFRSRAGQAHLTFSPIDHKLHLLGAEHGVWQIDDSRALRYANLNDDGYFDQWTYTEVISGTQPVTRTQQLNVAPSHLLFSDNDQLVIRQANVAPSVFETLPPSDQAEWQSLGDKLSANQRDLAPDDLAGMMRQFKGTETRITGAQLRDYRPVGSDGFRFVLTLEPDARVTGSTMLPLAELQPGDYAVSYNGSFQIAPLTPAAPKAIVQPSQLTQFETSQLEVALQNDGLEDLPPATLEMWAAPPQGEATLVTSDTVTLLAQTPVTTTLQWAPRVAGTWTLTTKLRQPNDQVTTLSTQQTVVQPAQPTSPDVMLGVSTFAPTQPFIILVAVTFAIVAAIVFGRQWRGAWEGRDELG